MNFFSPLRGDAEGRGVSLNNQPSKRNSFLKPLRFVRNDRNVNSIKKKLPLFGGSFHKHKLN